MKFFISLFFSLFIAYQVCAIDTIANEAIVVDFNTEEIIYGKNINMKTVPASMTKIMTVYVAFDRIKNTNLSLMDECTVSAKSYRMGGSRMFLEINDKVTINDLLKGIIIQSGNDASVTLAECLSGTEASFADLMNLYAEKLGLTNTNFINASGWPENNHFSSVRDLAIISNSLIKDFPDLYIFFSENEFTYNEIKQLNRNKLINSLKGTDGLKTGYTKKSGWGIAASAKRENRRVTVVLNGTNSSRTRLLESEKLINWAFRETSQKKILSKGQIIKQVDTWLGSKPTINLIIGQDVITTLSYEQIKSIKSKIEYEKPISTPIKSGDKLGKIKIEIPGKELITFPLVAEKNVGIVNPFYKVFAAIKYLVFGSSLDG